MKETPMKQHELQHQHDHDHAHGGHGGMVHEPAAETLAEYSRALEEAKPAPGGRILVVSLEAREIEWEFVPGKKTKAWGYNGQIPGPTIEANVGDVLEVRLTNSLPEATMIHWHGIRLPAPMDGTENVQRPVAPGATFVYRFVLRDAGTFWYHPHMNETVQLERGLYGALVVRDQDEPALDAERVLVLDDVELNSQSEIEPRGGWVEKHDGRQGSTLLLNGRSQPQLTIAAGQTERWRFVNASSARYARLSLGGRSFQMIGSDGGLLTRPIATKEVLLAPADRIDLAVGPFGEGESIRIESLEYDRGSIAQTDRELFATLYVGPRSPSRAMLPETLREITPLVSTSAFPTRTVRLGYRPTAQSPDFTINDESHHRAEPVKLGELQVWDIVNESALDHPFHLHGFFFQVVEINGKPPAYLSWEDTVNIPAKGTVRIAWNPDERPGEWMYHCHILEHHAGGMMAHFQIVN
jgi:FtsP/CotA-like multicopper oxidase with cupredoxin domain